MKKAAIIVLSLIIFSFVLLQPSFSISDNSEKVKVKISRFIEIKEGFIIIKDKIQVLNETDKLSFYISNDEYESLYALNVIPSSPIEEGLLYEDLIGFNILRNIKGNLTITRVHTELLFLEAREGLEIDIPAYFLTDNEVIEGKTVVKFDFQISNITIKSPLEAEKKTFVNGTTIVTYSYSNSTLFNVTKLDIIFNPVKGTKWYKITKFSRNFIFENDEKLKILDEVTLEYTGRGDIITEWEPILPLNAKIIEAKDVIGELKIEDNKIKLRNPLQIVKFIRTKSTIIVTSEIALKEIAEVDLRDGNINMNLNLLKNNEVLVDKLEIIIHAKILSNIKLEPLPDEISFEDYPKYKYILEKVFPGKEYSINLKAKIHGYVFTIDTFNQIVFILVIFLSFIFFYIRFAYLAKPTAPIIKIPYLEEYIKNIENLLIVNEEKILLEDKLRRGIIKKHEYNIRMSSLRKEIEYGEKEMRKISRILKEKNPELNKIITEIESSYYLMIKEIENLKQSTLMFKAHKISSEKFKRLYEYHNRNVQYSKSKIDSLLSELKEKL